MGHIAIFLTSYRFTTLLRSRKISLSWKALDLVAISTAAPQQHLFATTWAVPYPPVAARAPTSNAISSCRWKRWNHCDVDLLAQCLAFRQLGLQSNLNIAGVQTRSDWPLPYAAGWLIDTSIDIQEYIALLCNQPQAKTTIRQKMKARNGWKSQGFGGV